MLLVNFAIEVMLLFLFAVLNGLRTGLADRGVCVQCVYVHL